jgi:uncharacterized iron-regulated protein
MMTRALALAAVVACGGTPHSGTTPTGHERGVAAAGLPYHVLDREGHQLDEASFWAKLAAARAVCIGEEHPNPHHHWVQLEVVRRLAKQWPHFALGMEMFQRPFQGVLDDFAAGRIDDAALRTRAGWDERWGYDYTLYQPIIASAVSAHASLLALNAAKELTKKVVHHGLEGLTADERGQVPELDLKDARHRAWFDALMEGMGGTEAHSKGAGKDGQPAADDAPSADRVYTVQVIWDETMADTAAKWLAGHADAHLAILAGNGHCHDSAIVGRMLRRGVTGVVSVHTVIDDGSDDVAEALAKPMNDFIVVLELPAEVKAKLQQEQQQKSE